VLVDLNEALHSLALGSGRHLQEGFAAVTAAVYLGTKQQNTLVYTEIEMQYSLL